MDYEEMSDDEIASRVLNCTGYKSIDCGYGYEIFLSKESRNDVGIKSSGKFKFDPCNNPSDAWPIILENEISLVIVDDALWVARVGGIYSEGVNPLRAAMIVFLMVWESK